VNNDPYALHPFVLKNARAMIFVDGENLAIRYGSLLKAQGKPPAEHVWHIPSVAVWSPVLSPNMTSFSGTRVLRKHYYTSVQGDGPAVQEVADKLKAQHFEAPRVFKKSKTKGSKRVDISLATDMLLHAYRKHCDIAVLVAGDEDYVPLVQAVKSEGARVHIWFLSGGLSPSLQHEADHFVNLDAYLL
jgi:uncharacterized LabA/DUF88 family protein